MQQNGTCLEHQLTSPPRCTVHCLLRVVRRVVQFYVGHDSQMWGLAGTLALRWQAAGLPLLPTLPGSMIRFDRDGDTVTVTYHYPLFTDNSGVLYSTPANLGAVGGNQLSFSQLQSIASAGINPACVVEGPLTKN